MNDRSNSAHFSTIAIHAGARSDRASPLQPLTPSIANDPRTGFHDRTAELLAHLRVGESGLDAAQLQTVLEERVAALEGGSAAIACASGHVARLVALQTLMQPGDEIVGSRSWGESALGCRDDAFECFGWHFKWADTDKPESFVEALSDRTKAIVIESMAAFDGSIVDLEIIARVAQRARVPLIVDNTLATPYLVHPFEHGADVVLHCAATYLGAHEGVTAGFVVDGGTFDWTNDGRYPAITSPNHSCAGLVISDLVGNFAFALACRLAATRAFGPALGPTDPSLILHGIETLPLRMQRHADNALAVARHLAGHPSVRRVRYPGLESDPGQELAQRYCPNGAGAVLAFTISEDNGFTDRLRLMSRSDKRASRSAASSPAKGRHSGAAAREGGQTVVRLAIGLEDKNDIIADLDQALAT